MAYVRARAQVIAAVVMTMLLLPVAGCGANGVGQPSAQQVRTLVKADGWRELDAFGDDRPFGLVEIAYDRPTADEAWGDNVPDGLPSRSGDPREPGIYGDLDSVDFTTHAVIVWSAGQSGSCPGWLSGIELADDGTVELTTGVHSPFDACTDDYNAYRMLLAVPKNQLPSPSGLPTIDVTVDGRDTGLSSVVDSYPATGAGWPPPA